MTRRAAPLSRVRESRLGCRSGAERDQSAWVGGEGRAVAIENQRAVTVRVRDVAAGVATVKTRAALFHAWNDHLEVKTPSLRV